MLSISWFKLRAILQKIYNKQRNHCNNVHVASAQKKTVCCNIRHLFRKAKALCNLFYVHLPLPLNERVESSTQTCLKMSGKESQNQKNSSNEEEENRRKKKRQGKYSTPNKEQWVLDFSALQYKGLGASSRICNTKQVVDHIFFFFWEWNEHGNWM